MNISMQAHHIRATLLYRSLTALVIVMAFVAAVALPQQAKASPFDDQVQFYVANGADDLSLPPVLTAASGDHLINLDWSPCGCNDKIDEVVTKDQGVTLYSDWLFSGTSYYIPPHSDIQLPQNIAEQTSSLIVDGIGRGTV